MQLIELAHARTGDKGNISNIVVVARKAEYWPILYEEVTAERVKSFFSELVKGKVVRYEIPHLHALNFVLYDALRGGVTRSLALDAHGKCLSATLLSMEIKKES